MPDVARNRWAAYGTLSLWFQAGYVVAIPSLNRWVATQAIAHGESVVLTRLYQVIVPFFFVVNPLIMIWSGFNALRACRKDRAMGGKGLAIACICAGSAVLLVTVPALLALFVFGFGVN